jgi:alginate O-acetyltransferase complex protein AlgI
LQNVDVACTHSGGLLNWMQQSKTLRVTTIARLEAVARMLFNSYEFLCVFLPITLLGFQIAARWSRQAVIAWLTLMSLAFYGYWKPAYLLLLCASILFNYLCGSLISRQIPNKVSPKLLLGIAIGVNVAALCYYKYLFPTLNFLAAITGRSHRWHDIVLPLGISFFTFTQIAYLIDLQQEAVRQQDLTSYALFATFFPHLIAGPILHHAEVMPQFQQNKRYGLRADDMAIGFSWFAMGLFKKVILADNFAPAAEAAFSSTYRLSPVAAWAGVLSYALQLYFDFSGYSDMALGLARMFSIDFPLNFSSPYKAASITDFWQRWHMTLTRYINAYLYNPVFLWINRRRLAQGKKVSRKAMATPEGFASLVALPTMFSLFLAGIWHGAGVQFLIFGLLHGSYLSINQAWRTFRLTRPAATPPGKFRTRLNYASSVLLTFVAVCVAHVFFRSANVWQAFSIVASMVGLHFHPASAVVQSIAQTTAAPAAPYHPSLSRWGMLLVGYVIVWGLPNTQQILLKFKPAITVTKRDTEPGLVNLFWQPNAAWALVLGAVFLYTVIRMENPSSFLYFQF